MKPSLKTAATAAFLLQALPLVAAEQVPLYKTLKSWTVACDNTRQCTAISNGESEDGSPLTIRILREAGPEAPVHLSLISALELNGASPALILDGQPLESKVQRVQGDGEGEPDWIAEGPEGVALVDELRNGTQLSISLPDGEDAITDLAGLSASLLLIDSVQGRLDTRGALIRRGKRADTEVPPAPLAPSISGFRRAEPMGEEEAGRIGDAVLAATRDDWKDDIGENVPPSAEVFALDAQTALAIVQTWCGAYNCGYRLYKTPRAEPQHVVALKVDPLPTTDLGGEPSGTVGYDQETGELNSFNRGRGIGDCGVNQSWRYDGEGFRPSYLAIMGSCSGVSADFWPVLWRTQP